MPPPTRRGPHCGLQLFVTMLSNRTLLHTVLIAWALVCVPLFAQKKSNNEFAKLLKKGDPYTKKDPAMMKKLGVERYGPFPWADHFSTADIDKVLGPDRVIWMETKHFRIGLNLKTGPLPEDPKERKALNKECKALNKLCRKIPAKARKVGPWLRVHLYAQRCEKAYEQFSKLVGVTDSSFEAKSKVIGKGPYLGLPDKYLLLLFQKKSDMARYMKRFCNTEANESMRFYHKQTGQMVLAVSQEGMEGFDGPGLQAHVIYALWQNLMNGFRGYNYPLPMWFSTGIAHYYSRQVKTKFVNARITDTESVNRDEQNKWAKKVFRRSKHEGATLSYEQLSAMNNWEKFGFHAHMQSWSRIDYLMTLDSERLGLIIDKLKSVPSSGDWDAQAKQVERMLPKLLFNVFELDGATFDENWRKWVLKTYAKRKD
jgi:hypothetical protein